MTRRPRGTRRVTSELRQDWETVAPPEVPCLPLSTVSVPPRRHPQHSDLFGWHRVFPGKPRHREVQDRVSGPRPEARPLGPGAAAGRWVGLRSLSVREAPKPNLPLSHRCRENPGPACPWVARTDSPSGAELCSAARWGHPAPDGGGGGREGEVLCLRDRASGCVAAPGLRHLLSGAPGGPNPVRNSLSKGDRAEQSRRAIRPSDATVQRGL